MTGQRALWIGAVLAGALLIAACDRGGGISGGGVPPPLRPARPA